LKAIENVEAVEVEAVEKAGEADPRDNTFPALPGFSRTGQTQW